ncbi:MAG: glycosyltransferase [Planctomycetota bacterium]
MNIFMLGWEFPPFISGGLGTACYGLTRALSDLGHRVIFVLPQTVSTEFTTHVTLRTPAAVKGFIPGVTSYRLDEFDNVEFRSVPSTLKPYGPAGPGGMETVHHTGSTVTSETTDPHAPTTAGVSGSVISTGSKNLNAVAHYDGDMVGETERYAAVAVALARNENFDVVHAHDWMTYPAGIAVAQVYRKPLVVHVHSTEFDRSGEHVNQRIYDIERRGVHMADRVIAVSHFTRNLLLGRYGISPDRVEVVHNAIDTNGKLPLPSTIRRDEKIVLFLGRITMQKGPEYFLQAAKLVLQHEKNVRFVMAGSGDMARGMIELAAELGIGQKVVFTGFLRGDDVDRVYKMADLYVMPSVSEPFGIAPLEALSHDVPVIISKQSGVSEILTHVLKVDFWDTHEMANKIIAVLRHPPLQATLREHGSFEVNRLTWKDAAGGCVQAYGMAMGQYGRKRP